MGSQHRRRAGTASADESWRIAVKFRDEADVQPGEFLGLRAFLERMGHADGKLQMLPLITCMSAEALAELVEKARRLDPEYVPANFAKWFQVLVWPDTNTYDLLRVLRVNPLVETAYVMKPNFEPSPIPIHTMNSGSIASGGIGRSSSTTGSTSLRTVWK